jgi:hypothetical protein
MNIRYSNMIGDRPTCPVDRSHRIHGHGSYSRYSNSDGDELENIPRWICIVCRRTISVAPDNTIPYRPISTTLLEKWFDFRLRGHRPPAVLEKEKGCAERALERFLQRIPHLAEIMGQMIGVIRPTATQLWSELRRHAKLAAILGLLAERFKISLVGDYRCLRPWEVSV